MYCTIIVMHTISGFQPASLFLATKENNCLIFSWKHHLQKWRILLVYISLSPPYLLKAWCRAFSHHTNNYGLRRIGREPGDASAMTVALTPWLQRASTLRPFIEPCAPDVALNIQDEPINCNGQCQCLLSMAPACPNPFLSGLEGAFSQHPYLLPTLHHPLSETFQTEHSHLPFE